MYQQHEPVVAHSQIMFLIKANPILGINEEVGLAKYLCSFGLGAR